MRSRPGQTRWALANQDGSVVDVTDSNGKVVDHIQYDTYGNILSQTNASQQTRFGYAGMQTDAETGLYYDRARYYNPATGEFISVDPSGAAGSGTNLYQYAADNPASNVDPTGLISTNSWGGSGGSSAGQFNLPSPGDPGSGGSGPPALFGAYGSNSGLPPVSIGGENGLYIGDPLSDFTPSVDLNVNWTDLPLTETFGPPPMPGLYPPGDPLNTTPGGEPTWNPATDLPVADPLEIPWYDAVLPAIGDAIGDAVGGAIGSVAAAGAAFFGDERSAGGPGDMVDQEPRKGSWLYRAMAENNDSTPVPTQTPADPTTQPADTTQPANGSATDQVEDQANKTGRRVPKSPGVPTNKDGYQPPRSGPGSKGEMVKNPNGPGRGYLDKHGNVWIPTGEGSSAHGGPHWDVQTPGGGYVNIYPGGTTR